MIGTQLGPYEILEEIGHGGMATVYRANQANMDRSVAVKIIHKAIAIDQTTLDRFQREAKLIARLEHPHILPVYDYNGAHDPPYIVMRYMPTGTLKDILARDRLEFSEAAFLIRQIASALDYAHRQGVVHRDIKPSNIMVDSDGNAFLTDFGIARMIEGTEGLTASGLAVGTPGYMAPEQGMGLHIDNRADIYALGVMLFEMVTGKTPYHAETPMAVILKHISDPIPTASSINPDVPAVVDHIIMRAMAKEPDERYQTASKMANDLMEAIGASATITPKHLQQIAAQTIAEMEEARAEMARQASMQERETLQPGAHEPGYAGPPSPASPALPPTRIILPGVPEGKNRRLIGYAIGGVGVIAAVAVGIILALSGGDDGDESGVVTSGTCPIIAQQALDVSGEQCAAVDDNSICLGNQAITLTPRPGETVVFDAAGDQVPLSAVKSIRTRALDETSETWGIAVINAQVDLDDDEQVQFVLFGEAQLDPLDEHLRSFKFLTSSEPTACAEAAHAGLIVQVPPDKTIHFTANGIDITVSSTLVLHAQPAGQMIIYVLDGEATVTARGSTFDVPTGYATSLTMSAALRALGPPSPPERIPDMAAVLNLEGSSPLVLLAEPLKPALVATTVALVPELTNTPVPPTKTPTLTPSYTPTTTDTPTSTPTDTPT
ncbi:MAG: serine/threonine protein kinase, partial [Anaerolineae bacterium]|nr:serine/threonine protein kinase [Anaerolineae bacterium]